MACETRALVRALAGWLVCATACAYHPTLVAAQDHPVVERQTTAPVLDVAAQETFLRKARVLSTRRASKGTTGVLRATLSDGTVTHDASIQAVDQRKSKFQGAKRVELEFRDYWGYNVAAYRVAVLLGLDMLPPSIARSFRGTRSAFTWWVDDVLMDEQDRVKRGEKAPDLVHWNRQVYTMRLFDELIANIDRNQGNMIIDTRWKLWLIDHTRAFRTYKHLSSPASVRGCERQLFGRLKALTLEQLEPELKPYLNGDQIRSILVRRDLIVEHLEAIGPGAFYDEHPPRLAPSSSDVR